MDWGLGSWGGAPRVLALGAGLVVAGCSEPPREEEAGQQPTGNEAATGTPSSSTSTSTPDTTPTSGSASADSSTGDDDDDIKLDVGPSETTGVTTTDPDGDMGCKKVDFLFVIDNSGSMGDEQTT